MTLIAYHGKDDLRAEVVAEMVAHAKADRLVQGHGYWDGGKGCAVGCLLKSGNHAEYEQRFGIPQALARLEDIIFESLPCKDVMGWPVRFLSAPRPGADLSLVQWGFLDFIVTEALSWPEAKTVREACQPALEIVCAAARGELIGKSAARAAESAARAACAARAAESAAWKRYADKLVELMASAPVPELLVA